MGRLFPHSDPVLDFFDQLVDQCLACRSIVCAFVVCDRRLLEVFVCDRSSIFLSCVKGEVCRLEGTRQRRGVVAKVPVHVCWVSVDVICYGAAANLYIQQSQWFEACHVMMRSQACEGPEAPEAAF